MLYKRILGEEHPDVATSLNNIATLYYDQGHYSEAEPLYTQALALRRRILGEEHPDVASSLNNLGDLYRSQGHYSEAECLFLQAIIRALRCLGEDHPNTQIFISNFIRTLKEALNGNQSDQLSDHPLTQHLLAQLRDTAD